MDPVSPRKSEKPSVLFWRLPPTLFFPEKATFENEKDAKTNEDEIKHNENEKDTRRKMIAICLINPSSSSVSNPNVKNTWWGTLWTSVDNPMWWMGVGVSISQEGGVGRWDGGLGRWLGGEVGRLGGVCGT